MSIGYGTPLPSDGWVKVFRHNVAGGYFSNANDWEEVKNTNIGGPNGNKYSQLFKISKMTLNNEYVLKMVMDSFTNTWAQTHNPLENAPYASTVPGYRAIDVQTAGNSWGGISRSDGAAAFIDANPLNSNWYYPLGPSASWNGGLPQYDSTGHPFVELWVKIR